jgi:hypothetical protein
MTDYDRIETRDSKFCKWFIFLYGLTLSTIFIGVALVDTILVRLEKQEFSMQIGSLIIGGLMWFMTFGLAKTLDETEELKNGPQ